MKICDFLREDLVLADLAAPDKATVLAEMAGAIARAHGLPAARLTEVLLEREKLGSTGIGEGVAIPHGKLPGLPGLLAALGRSRKGVEFAALDGKPAHLFVVLFAPDNSAGIHLKALARLSRLFRNPALRRGLLDAPDAAAIYKLVADEDGKY